MMNICFTRLGITANHYPHRALSPCHLLTRSDDDTDMNVLSACEATAFAKYDLPARQHNHQHAPVPGGPYIRMPFQGCLFPTKNSGWMVGRITAPISSSFATAKPATSSHLMFGFSVTMAWASWLFNLLSSSLPPPPSAFAGFFTSTNQQPALLPTRLRLLQQLGSVDVALDFHLHILHDVLILLNYTLPQNGTTTAKALEQNTTSFPVGGNSLRYLSFTSHAVTNNSTCVIVFHSSLDIFTPLLHRHPGWFIMISACRSHIMSSACVGIPSS